MTDLLKVETTYKPHIRGQIQSGSMVLFTGAGFSLEAQNINGHLIPSADNLTKKIWDLCYPSEEFEENVELQDIYEDACDRFPQELKRLLQENFTVGNVFPKWYSEIMSVPWFNSYTLNIDDLMEKVYQSEQKIRKINSISCITDNISKISADRFNLFHLNGKLDDAPDNIVFSKTQYAKRIGTDPFYQQLAADLISRPVVFIGSNLNEAAMWEHIISRGIKGERTNNELRPRSYLVIPRLTRPKQAVLEKYNIVWLPMSGEEFTEEFITPNKDVFVEGFKSLKHRTAHTSMRSAFSYVSDLIAKCKTPTSEYLLGNEPSWHDLVNGKVAERKCFEELDNKVNELRASSEIKKFIILTGTAGTGKSSALMREAIKLSSEGLNVAWLDSDYKYTKSQFLTAIKSHKTDVICINDSDIYGSLLSNIIREALVLNPRLLILIEVRSNKVDRVISSVELKDITPVETVMPGMTDSDIDAILDVLEKENRLGVLKGKDRDDQVGVFKKHCNRQLLVAMMEATSGQKFEEKIISELDDLDSLSKIIYGLISVASAHRFSLTKDEILIGCADSSNVALNVIDKLVRRKLVVLQGSTYIKSRHRMIAQVVYEELVKSGRFLNILEGLILLSVSKVSERTVPNTRLFRILKTFINHNFIKNCITMHEARKLYSEFQESLSWDPHYWLHRGALELENGNIELAENFLNQAINMRPDDVLIQTEWAYFQFKKAITNPDSLSSQKLVDEAIIMLKGIIARRLNMSGHAYHILVRNGLQWTDVGLKSQEDKESFLQDLKILIRDATSLHGDTILLELKDEVDRAILSLAIKK